MTYIDYMNQFWRLADYESFAASEVALYAFLFNECNKFHWQMPFSCPTFHVCNRLRIKGCYNAREASERNFDMQNNDFGRSIPNIQSFP